MKVFRGPFGIWPYPVINFLLRIVELLKSEGSQPLISTSHSLKPAMANVERWQWIDYKGRKRELVIEREVKTLGE